VAGWVLLAGLRCAISGGVEPGASASNPDQERQPAEPTRLA
jgi:hypothetical protein